MKLKHITLTFTLIYSLLWLGTPLYGQNQDSMTETVEEAAAKNLKRKVAIGRFSNETKYGKSVFYNKDNDPMEKQAQDLLVSKLAAADKFLLLERSDLSKLDDEVGLSGQEMVQRLGADYGSVHKVGDLTYG